MSINQPAGRPVGDLLAAIEKLPPLIKSTEVAAFMGVCLRTVRRWIKRGLLHASKTCPGRNGRYRVHRESLRQMLVGGK